MSVRIIADSASQALALASKRSLLPTAMGTAEIRDMVAAAIRQNSMFSARTANAHYLQYLKARIERLLQGGHDNDWAQIRLELKEELRRLLYTPEKGFPGDEALGIPPAEPGSLRDLSSDRRLNLILRTQEELMRGSALKTRGLDGSRVRQFPCWELVRRYPRAVPRGSKDSKSKSWVDRFEEAGGTAIIDAEGRERLMALKTDPVWAGLGDSSLFSDALDTDHPPFAFESGMGWKEVHWRDAADVMGDDAIRQARSVTPAKPKEDPEPAAAAEKALPEPKAKGDEKAAGSSTATEKPAAPVPTVEPDKIIPAPKASVKSLDDDTKARLRAALKQSRETHGVLTMSGILAKGGAP